MSNYTISSFISSIVDSYKSGQFTELLPQNKIQSYPELDLGSHYSADELLILKNDIQTIICDVLNVDKTYLYLNSNKQLSETELEQINSKVLRLINGEPLAYILGYKYFWGQKLFVTSDTLIPRADTEVLVEAVLKDLKPKVIPDSDPESLNRKFNNQNSEILNQVQDGNKSLKKRLKILDLGTGTGAIALALAGELPNSEVVAVDFFQNALDIAKKNAKKNNISNVEFVQSNWYENIKNRKFDIIVANPPYIDFSDLDIDQEVKKYEPSTALFAEENGLADIKTIISQARGFLEEKGKVYIEHGFSQATQIQKIFKENGFVNIQTIKDLNDMDRCTQASIK